MHCLCFVYWLFQAQQRQLPPVAQNHRRSLDSGIEGTSAQQGLGGASPCVCRRGRFRKPGAPTVPLAPTRTAQGRQTHRVKFRQRGACGERWAPAGPRAGSEGQTHERQCRKERVVGLWWGGLRPPPAAHRPAASQGPFTCAQRTPSPAGVCSSSSLSSSACGQTSQGTCSGKSSLATRSSSSTQPTW